MTREPERFFLLEERSLLFITSSIAQRRFPL
jgi:hypothetical protein